MFSVWTAILLADKNYWCIATALACIACIIVYGLCSTDRDTQHIIQDVKTVQIDTVVNTCKDVSDTTYVIKYLK